MNVCASVYVYYKWGQLGENKSRNRSMQIIMLIHICGVFPIIYWYFNYITTSVCSPCIFCRPCIVIYLFIHRYTSTKFREIRILFSTSDCSFILKGISYRGIHLMKLSGIFGRVTCRKLLKYSVGNWLVANWEEAPTFPLFYIAVIGKMDVSAMDTKPPPTRNGKLWVLFKSRKKV